MKKAYIRPASLNIRLMAESMMAASLGKSDETITDGSQIRSGERQSPWDSSLWDTVDDGE